MRKGEHCATSELWPYVFGWAPAQVACETVRRGVCRTQHQVFDYTQAWRAALLQRGWSD